MFLEQLLLTLVGDVIKFEVEDFLLDLLFDGHQLNLTEKTRSFKFFFSRGVLFKRVLFHELIEGEGSGHVEQSIV